MASTAPTAAAATSVVDPFGYWPNLASRIEGLGGAETPPDPNYAFHSPYLSCEAGRNRLTIAFTGLRSAAGELTVRIFSYAEDRATKIKEDRAVRVSLRELSATRRPVTVAFDAEPEHQYAIGGYIFGAAVAEAKALSLGIGPAGEHEDDQGVAPSAFGHKRARRMFALQADQHPSIAFPVSQAFTPEQTTEPAFERWITPLNPPPPTPEAQWEVAYILETLAIYGRLARGVRALGFALDNDPVAQVLREHGAALTLVAPDFGAGFDDRLIAATAIQGDDQSQAFDVIWSRRAEDTALTELQARDFLDRTLDYCAPGGLAVHTVAMPATEPLHAGAPRPGIDRNAMKRIALGIVSQGHIVGQLKLPHRGTIDTPGVTIPFGIVIRKAAPVVATTIETEDA